jgi:uncharacterized membrane protein YphA (DoxX/SURF4 family)
MTKKITSEIITALLVLLFMYAAVSKLIDYSIFKKQLEKSPLLSQIAPLLAIVIPAAELFISVLLLQNKTRLKGLYASFCLMMAFTIYLIGMLNFSKVIPCSCGGIIRALSWKEHVIFNLAFIFLSVAGIIRERKSEQNQKDTNGINLQTQAG